MIREQLPSPTRCRTRGNGAPPGVAQVAQAQDYTAFGAAMEGRSFSISSYRFGFQGMEKEGELYGDGNAYYTQYRMLDVRIGRWFSTDPVVQPWMSPYTAFDNNPIFLVDPLGLKSRDESGTVRNGDYKNFWDVLKHRSPKETLKVWGNAVRGLFSGGGGDTRRVNKMLGSRGISASDEDFPSKNRGGVPKSSELRTNVAVMNFLSKIGAYSTNDHFKQLARNLESGASLNYIPLQGTVGGSEANQVVSDLIAHFKKNSGTDFTSPILNHEAANVESVLTMQDRLEAHFKAQMAKQSNDYSKVSFSEDFLRQHTVGSFSLSDSPLLKTLVGGIQETQVWLETISLGKNGTYTAVLRTDIYDDFGVQETDITNASFPASMAKGGMTSLWILQNQRGYKPFRVKISLRQTVKSY